MSNDDHPKDAHRCPESCDECADYDCVNRRPGRIPACDCRCHVECFAAMEARRESQHAMLRAVAKVSHAETCLEFARTDVDEARKALARSLGIVGEDPVVTVDMGLWRVRDGVVDGIRNGAWSPAGSDEHPQTVAERRDGVAVCVAWAWIRRDRCLHTELAPIATVRPLSCEVKNPPPADVG